MRYALSAALCCLLASTAARANPPTKSIQLIYATRGPGADTCPAESTFRNEVRFQVAYDPFRPDAPHRLTATITAAFTPRGREFTGALQIQDATGHIVWEQDKLTTMAPCATLVKAMAIAVGGWWDEPPSEEATAAPSRPLEPPPLQPAPAPVSPAPAPPSAQLPLAPPTPSSMELRMGLDALVNAGVTPSPSIGAGYVVELRPKPAFSLELALRGAWTPQAMTERGASIRSGYLSGVLAPCGRVLFLFGCAVLELGTVRSLATPSVHIETFSPIVLSIGGRVGAEWSFGRGRFSLRGLIETKGVPTVTYLWLNWDEARRTPPIWASFGVGLTARL